MLGKIIDINTTEAFVNLLDGTTIDIGVSRIPPKSKIGDTIDIPVSSTQFINDKLTGFF